MVIQEVEREEDNELEDEIKEENDEDGSDESSGEDTTDDEEVFSSGIARDFQEFDISGLNGDVSNVGGGGVFSGANLRNLQSNANLIGTGTELEGFVGGSTTDKDEDDENDGASGGTRANTDDLYSSQTDLYDDSSDNFSSDNQQVRSVERTLTLRDETATNMPSPTQTQNQGQRIGMVGGHRQGEVSAGGGRDSDDSGVKKYAISDASTRSERKMPWEQKDERISAGKYEGKYRGQRQR